MLLFVFAVELNGWIDGHALAWLLSGPHRRRAFRERRLGGEYTYEVEAEGSKSGPVSALLHIPGRPWTR